MPINEKGEWINPPENPFPKDELERGYSECACGHGISLHQAGYDAEMYLCGMCKREVADAVDFFKFQDGIRAMSK